MTTLSENVRIWDQTLLKIEDKLGEKQLFDSFFAGSYIYEVRGDTIFVVVNSGLAAQLMATKYYDLIKNVVADVTSEHYKLEFILQSQAKKYSEPTPVVVVKNNYFKEATINQELTFDNFVVGPFNREASQAALFVASNPGKTFAQPLFLFSNAGLGKTHLMHAIGNYVIKNGRPGTKVLYVQAQDFIDEYIKYVRGEKEADTIKDYICGFDVLLFDDIQMLKDKVKTQEQLFEIYEKMANSGKQLVFASDRQPNELNGLEERLISRFNQGLTVKIENPDQNTCVEILRKKIEENKLNPEQFDDELLYFYAEKFSKNVRELEGALNRLMFVCSLMPKDERITLDVGANAVSSLVGGKSLANQLSEQKIINIVADYYNLLPSQLTGKNRTGQVSLARHIAMYLIRNNLDASQEKIGAVFGGKDHTSVMYAISKVDKELKTSEELRTAISDLTKRLKK